MASPVATLELDPVVPAPRPVIGRRPAAFLVTLPDRLMTWFLTVSVVVSVALLAGQFRPWLVFPVAVVAVILTSRFVPLSPEVNRLAVVGTGVAVLTAIAWYLVQRGHTAQMIGLDRDPAQYTLSALYLMHHASPDVVLDPALPALAAKVPGVMTDFLQGNSGAVNHIQGNDLLPGWLAVFGWLHGAAGVFTGNVAIGALALLSVYALARRILGPLWALAPMALLAVTMPLAAFSRMPYTEPTALIFVCGMSVALWVAIRERSLRLYALSGAFAGATMIARIDGGLTVVAVLSALALLALAPVTAIRRREGRLAMLVFLWGAVPAGALGWLDLAVHSPKYLSGLSGELYPVLAAVPVVLALGLGLSLLRPVTGRLAVWMSDHRKGLTIGAGVVVAIGCVVMVSRPLWLVDHFVKNRDGGDYVGAVAARQKSEGLAIDGTRSYDEMSISWMAWYLGWIVVGAALVGAVLVAVEFCRKRRPELLAMWTVPVLVGLVYLNKIAITPDQIWALRRLLPVVIPMTAIAAAFALRAVVMRLPRTSFRAVGVAVVAFLMIQPATNWGSAMFDSREGVGEYDLVNQICQLSGDGLIVQAGAYPIMGSALPALQELCSDKVVSVSQATPATMAQIAANWKGKGPITVVVFFPESVTWTRPVDGHQPLGKVIFSRWESVISRKPSNLNLQQVSFWLGTLQSNGQVTPLNTAPFPQLLPGS
ncbi:Dolichyl-phosphate-mannose-protein mannosyltransferase [Nakamurella panacisegetis]|uniref:Dolichyl-phosphate-mannose-protein mannosyltransferase n=1 Tax=Nakamurella panacisegetis TaxID=1090615 RepID=A0A1H0K9W2_9ACTN|nr:glycosyltransferase family 39 protein [Nakamurella panacisegetis]SDO52745.1 Dolichyl-phosphate-mannose-protein mannosyltransferase [Nakamurella panacisegetis]